MKKIIIFGNLFAVFILLMLPNINAVEYQTLDSMINKQNDDFHDVFNGFSNLNNESGFFKKILTIFLFVIDFLFLLSFPYTSNFLNEAFEIFINQIIDALPILSLFLIFLSMFIINNISLKPANFVFGLIKKIEAWNKEKLWLTHELLAILSYITFIVLEKLGITNIIDDTNNDLPYT